MITFARTYFTRKSLCSSYRFLLFFAPLLSVAPVRSLASEAGVEPLVQIDFTYFEKVFNDGGTPSQKSFEVVINPPQSEAFTLSYSVLNRYTTAVNPSEFDLKSSSIVIPAGASSASIAYRWNGSLVGGSSKIIQVSLSRASIPFRSVIRGIARHLIRSGSGTGDPIVSISTSLAHGCGITKAGSLKCWGNNEFGQLGDGTVVNKIKPILIDAGVSYSTVSTGSRHTCAITRGGLLKCWGQNKYGQLGDGSTTDRTLPKTIDAGYLAVALGLNHSCAIRASSLDLSSGTVYCWGSGMGRQSVSPYQVDIELYTSVTTGASHACGLTRSKSVRCWGANNSGQLGNGTYSSGGPVWAGGTSGYTAISAGAVHTCGIKTDGKVWCWGSNSFGELGVVGYTSFGSNKAVMISDNQTSYLSISAFGQTTCGTTNAKELKCWGHGGLLPFDTGKIEERNFQPKAFDFGTFYENVTVGPLTCGKLSDGALKCWSQTMGNICRNLNSSDPAVDCRASPTSILFDDRALALSPIPIDAPTEYESISVGNGLTCAITKQDHRLKCWGTLTNFLGGGSFRPTTTTPMLMDSNLYQAVSVGGNVVCGILASGKLFCSGNNVTGLVGVGYGSLPSAAFIPPTEIDSGTLYKFISVGSAGYCGITTEDKLKCVGQVAGYKSYSSNSNYQHALTAIVPTEVDPGVIYRDAGMLISFLDQSRITPCGITTYGALKCYDSKDLVMKEIDPGTIYNKLGRIFASHFCGLTVGGDLNCFGSNEFGQLGGGHSAQSVFSQVSQTTAPIKISIHGPFRDVASGSHHTCAIPLYSFSGVPCWGSNFTGQLGLNQLVNFTEPPKYGSYSSVISIGDLKYYCSFDRYSYDRHEIRCHTNDNSQELTPNPGSFLVSQFFPQLPAFSTPYECKDIRSVYGPSYSTDLRCTMRNDSAVWAIPTSGTSPSGLEYWSRPSILSAGESNTCAIDYYGKLYCWGNDSSGQLGDGALIGIPLTLNQ